MNILESITTDREIIMFVENHLLTQDKKSISVDDGMCMYKDDSGKNLSCAIGCLISEDFYSKDMERKGLSNSLVMEIIRKSLPNWKVNFDLLDSLQSIHDQIDIEDWDYALDHLGKDYIEYGVSLCEN